MKALCRFGIDVFGLPREPIYIKLPWKYSMISRKIPQIWSKTNLCSPPWLEKILKFEVFKWLKLHLKICKYKKSGHLKIKVYEIFFPDFPWLFFIKNFYSLTFPDFPWLSLTTHEKDKIFPDFPDCINPVLLAAIESGIKGN